MQFIREPDSAIRTMLWDSAIIPKTELQKPSRKRTMKYMIRHPFLRLNANNKGNGSLIRRARPFFRSGQIEQDNRGSFFCPQTNAAFKRDSSGSPKNFFTLVATDALSASADVSLAQAAYAESCRLGEPTLPFLIMAQLNYYSTSQLGRRPQGMPSLPFEATHFPHFFLNHLPFALRRINTSLIRMVVHSGRLGGRLDRLRYRSPNQFKNGI